MAIVRPLAADYHRRMSIISVLDLHDDLLAFLQRVEAGESFVVVSGQRPLAEVRPVTTPAHEPRPFGLCAGQLVVPPDFGAPLPEKILEEFETGASPAPS